MPGKPTEAASLVIQLAWLVLVTAIVAGGMGLAFAVSPLFGLGGLVIPLLAFAVIVLARRNAVAASFERLSPGNRPLALAATMLALVTAVGAVWLPAAVIGFSGSRPWSYQVETPLSFLCPLAAAVGAGLLARWDSRLWLATVAIGFSALAASIITREALMVAANPKWCYVSKVSATRDGGREVIADSTGCAVLFKQGSPPEGPLTF